MAISAYNNHQWRKNLFNQTDLSFDLDTGGIRHRILAGLELGKQDTDYLRKTGIFSHNAASVNVPLDHPDGALPVNYVVGGGSADRDGSSAADHQRLPPGPDRAERAMAAGRRFALRQFQARLPRQSRGRKGAVAPSAADLSSDDNLVSPRLGLVFKPVPAATLYANYSVASFPRGGDQLSSLTSINQGLKPEKFTNYEVGAKLEINPDLLATLAVYRLDRNNVAVTNPVTGIADQLVDGQRTNGAELGINGRITSAWSINGGYAHQHAKLLATAGATALNGAIVGMVPKNTISLWNRYDFSQALGAGLGVSWR